MDNAHLIDFKTSEPGCWNEEQASCVRMIFNPSSADIEAAAKRGGIAEMPDGTRVPLNAS